MRANTYINMSTSETPRRYKRSYRRFAVYKKLNRIQLHSMITFGGRIFKHIIGILRRIADQLATSFPVSALIVLLVQVVLTRTIRGLLTK